MCQVVPHVTAADVATDDVARIGYLGTGIFRYVQVISGWPILFAMRLFSFFVNPASIGTAIRTRTTSFVLRFMSPGRIVAPGQTTAAARNHDEFIVIS